MVTKAAERLDSRLCPDGTPSLVSVLQTLVVSFPSSSPFPRESSLSSRSFSRLSLKSTPLLAYHGEERVESRDHWQMDRENVDIESRENKRCHVDFPVISSYCWNTWGS